MQFPNDNIPEVMGNPKKEYPRNAVPITRGPGMHRLLPVSETTEPKTGIRKQLSSPELIALLREFGIPSEIRLGDGFHLGEMTLIFPR